MLNSSNESKGYTRRDVVKSAGVTALGLLLAGLPPLRGGLFAGTGDAPGVTKLKIGFIPLTDCASVVMASELGLYKKYGLDVTVSKEASWAAVRDNGDARHVDALLAGVPEGSILTPTSS